jgi:CubicO group peptidase (beta-lactamase class C family)
MAGKILPQKARAAQPAPFGTCGKLRRTMRRFRPFRSWLVILLVTLSPATALEAEVRGALGATLDRYLKALVGYGYSGAVLVAKHGEIVLNQGYGLADRARQAPFTADTLFDIASISKQFTAAAILRLEMQGKLKVEDKLARFFPSAPPDKAGITLHQLLTHTSGLAESFGEEYEPVTREAFLRRVFASTLRHPPGRRFEYSDAGYAVLAAVVEVVSRRPFGDVLRDEVFRPAGMHHSGFLPNAEDRKRLAQGYTLQGAWGTPLDHPRAPDGPWWNLRGNGGILTTTGDLYLWNAALQGDAVLSRTEREKYQRPYVRETGAPEPKYAYGWSVSTSPTGRRRLAHVGGNGAFGSDYRRFPEDGVVIVVAANTADYSAILTADQIERRVFGKPVVEPPATVAARQEELQRCAGDYALASGERLKVAAEPGRLAITPEGREGLALLFGTPGTDRQGRFAARDRKVGHALEALSHGAPGPLAELLGLSVDRGAERWRAALAASKAEAGAWKGAQVLGTESNGGVVVTYARLTFAKGTRVLDVTWAGPNAESLAVGRSLQPAYYLPERALPEGPARFATYDVGTSSIVHLSCGAPALRFETANGKVEARRLPVPKR